MACRISTCGATCFITRELNSSPLSIIFRITEKSFSTFNQIKVKLWHRSVSFAMNKSEVSWTWRLHVLNWRGFMIFLYRFSCTIAIWNKSYFISYTVRFLIHVLRSLNAFLKEPIYCVIQCFPIENRKLRHRWVKFY